MAFNEYFENIDPIYLLYRGTKLLNYIGSSPEYGEQFKQYIYSLTEMDLHSYLSEVTSIYFSGHSSNDEFRFAFYLDKPKKIFDSFSERDYPIEERFILEALHIKKSPFYKIGNNKYLLLDDKFLLEKCYELVIWDFLFTALLSNTEDSERGGIIKSYRGFIGYFFEAYVREKIERAFYYYRHPVPKLFDDLKINGHEYGDIYIRHNKKIIIGEVKSSGVPSNSKYGETVSDLYNNNKDEFYKKHGLKQIVRNLEHLLNSPELYDKKLDLSRSHKIYPIIVTNERILTIGIFIQLFNDEFNKWFDRKKYPNHLIKPLLILHISDLEFLEEYCYLRKIDFFKYLDNHFKKYPIILKLSMSTSSLSPLHPKYILQEITKFIQRE